MDEDEKKDEKEEKEGTPLWVKGLKESIDNLADSLKEKPDPEKKKEPEKVPVPPVPKKPEQEEQQEEQPEQQEKKRSFLDWLL